MSTELLCSPAGLRQLKAVVAAAVTAHAPVVLPSGLVAVPLNSEEAGIETAFCFEAECIAVDKATGQAWTGGQKIYWNDTAKNFTTADSGNTVCGYALQPAASADDRGHIHLTPKA